MVSGQWSGLTTDKDSKSTDISGKAVLESDRLRYPHGNFTLNITDVTLSGWEYRPGENKKTTDSIIVP